MSTNASIVYTIDGMGGGGAERSLAELLPGVQAAGWQPTVACLFRRSEGVQDDLLEAGFDLRFLPGRLPAKAIALRRLLAERRPALVHSTLFQATLLSRIASGRRGVPLVTSLVNTPYDLARLTDDPGSRRAAVRVVQAVDRALVGRTAHFHAITNAVKDATVRDLGVDPDRITVIERGRDPVRLGLPSPDRRDRVRGALGIPPSARVVLNVGRQEYQKGQRDLVAAARTLAPSHPDLIVLIAGRPGTASAELDAAITEAGLGDQVRVLGFRSDLPDLLAAADLFAFPSLYEGLGGALIEAMALGLPIVASDIPAVREVLEPGGNADLVSASDSGALAGAIGALLEDPARARAYGVRSRERFEERFTLAGSTARMLQLYDDVLRGS